MLLKVFYIAVTLQFFVINIESKNTVVVSGFEDIKSDPTLSTLAIVGKETFVESSSLSPQVFGNVPNIVDLFIINILGSLSINVFTSLHKLQHLKIENNRLIRIGPGVWSGLELEKLNLRNNQIEELDQNAFDGLKTPILDLSNNNLRKLPNKCLKSLRLYKLTLANNQLKFIDLDTFGPELAYADLSNNKLTSLDFAVFNGVYALLYLDVSGNKLTSIESTPLLKKVQRLDYSRNEISILKPGAFAHYEDLAELRLDHNELFELSHKAFPASTPIKTLTIDQNYLTGLSSNLLNRLDSLKFLKFGGNPWSCKCLQQIVEFIQSNEIGTDSCEAKLLKQRDQFCVDIFDQCTGKEPKHLSHHFNIYDEFIKNYQCQ